MEARKRGALDKKAMEEGGGGEGGAEGEEVWNQSPFHTSTFVERVQFDSFWCIGFCVT